MTSDDRGGCSGGGLPAMVPADSDEPTASLGLFSSSITHPFPFIIFYIHSLALRVGCQVIKKLGSTCMGPINSIIWVHFIQVQQIKPKFALTEQKFLFVCFVQQIPQSVV
jgi:hypothetical protein